MLGSFILKYAQIEPHEPVRQVARVQKCCVRCRRKKEEDSVFGALNAVIQAEGKARAGNKQNGKSQGEETTGRKGGFI